MRLLMLSIALLGCQPTSSQQTTRQALGSACEDSPCFEDGPPPDARPPDARPPDAPPPDAPRPPLTDCDVRGNPASDILLGLRMAAAAACKGVNPGNMNGYGCFCGEGNTGINTKPVDKLDTCCQQHDIDWHAICQNTPEVAKGTKGCNCYTNTPALNCDTNTHTLSLPDNLTACQKACGEELMKNSACMGDNKGDWNKDYWQGDPTIRSPFAGDCPSYCKKGDAPPNSTFGPVKLPDNQNYPTCKQVMKEDMPPDGVP